MSAIAKPLPPDFSEAVLKVQRAKSHVADFERAAGRFFARHPQQVGFHPHLKRDRYGFGVYDRHAFPGRQLALIVGDAIHNLRAALDYLIAECARANGKTFNDTGFPIVNRKANLEDRLKDGVRNGGPIAMQLVRDAKPYPRGNNALFAIHKLDLADKHQLILPVASVVDVEITSGGWNNLPHVRSVGKVSSASNKGKFIPVPEGYEAAVPTEMSFTGEIVFARGRPLAGEPCVAGLDRLCEAVTVVIEAFEDGFSSLPFSQSLRQHKPPVASRI